MTVKTPILSTDAHTKAKWWRPTDAAQLINDCIFHVYGHTHWVIEASPAHCRSREIIKHVLPEDAKSNTSIYTISLDEECKTEIHISIKGESDDRGRAYVSDILSLDRLLAKMLQVYKEANEHEHSRFNSDRDKLIERKMLLELKLELFIMK